MSRLSAVEGGESRLGASDASGSTLRVQGSSSSRLGGASAPSQSSLTAVDRLKSELGARDTDSGTLVSMPGDVLFDFDKAEIRDDAKTVLEKLARLIAESRAAEVEVEGHTDAKGEDEYNLDLSERRAESVARYLVEAHAVDARLAMIGKGEAEPVAPNETATGVDDPQGRQQNRRVDVTLR